MLLNTMTSLHHVQHVQLNMSSLLQRACLNMMLSSIWGVHDMFFTHGSSSHFQRQHSKCVLIIVLSIYLHLNYLAYMGINHHFIQMIVFWCDNHSCHQTNLLLNVITICLSAHMLTDSDGLTGVHNKFGSIDSHSRCITGHLTTEEVTQLRFIHYTEFDKQLHSPVKAKDLHC